MKENRWKDKGILQELVKILAWINQVQHPIFKGGIENRKIWNNRK